MSMTISDFEYDYLEDKARIGLTKEEYLVIKQAINVEKVFNAIGADFNAVDTDTRVIAIVCSAFGFYIDQTGELTFAI